MDAMTRMGTEGKAGISASFSRREMLKGATALIAGYTTVGTRYATADSGSERKRFVYAGTYDSSLDSGVGHGRGIYLFEMNPASGELRLVKMAAEARNPSWLAFHPSGHFLYSANEIDDFEGKGGGGAVSAYAIDRASGALLLLNRTRSEGAGPAHLSVDATGRYVFVANYFGGTVAVLPIAESGTVGSAVFTQSDTGSVGSRQASTGPQGSFAISGHDKPHAHMIHPDLSNRFVLHTDLGQDRLYVHRFDAKTGNLQAAGDAAFVSLPDGDGPRHFVFHSNGRWLYCLQEEASTVVFFHFDPKTGSLQPQQTISTLPAQFRGTSFTSEILLSRDGQFLYTANRLHDSIAVFSLNQEGRLTYVGETATEGDYPRHLSLDPSGTFLYACNQRSDAITCFRLDPKRGMPVFTGQFTALGSPACLVFLD